MNRLAADLRARIIGMMVEGVSIRAITRMTGVNKNTVAKLLADAGQACLEYQDKALRNLSCKRIQADEIWSFVYSKQKNVPEEKRGQFGYGDVWTWTAIDADSKLIVSWYLGRRDAEAAYTFMTDLASRLTNRVQLTTDGHHAYLCAVDAAFDRDIDYAMLVKQYGTAPEAEKRYSPPICLGAEKSEIRGRPDPEHISTSYVERQNLSMRMGMRRFTRLTNAFSKKFANHMHALSIYFMHYNFVRIHQTLRCMPAMQAGVTDRLWDLNDIVAVVGDWEATQKNGEKQYMSDRAKQLEHADILQSVQAPGVKGIKIHPNTWKRLIQSMPKHGGSVGPGGSSGSGNTISNKPVVLDDTIQEETFEVISN